MSVAGLLLGDSRFPAGGHAYSGGVEPAVTAGIVTDLRTLEVFLRGRLHTAGLVAAGIAAAACAGANAGISRRILKYPEFHGADLAAESPDDRGGAGDATGGAGDRGTPARADDATRSAGERGPAGAAAGSAGDRAASGRQEEAPGESAALVRRRRFWSELDAEADARTPAPAQREASRRQGRTLLRAARVAWPEAPGLAELAVSAGAGRGRETRGPAGAGVAVRSDVDGGTTLGGRARREYRGGPHHAVVLGAAAAAAGCDHREAARIAAYQAVAGPVSAAVRLLALDPLRATAILAGIAGDIDQVAARAAGYADGPLGDLPCASAPALDLLAETHIRAEVRLFES